MDTGVLLFLGAVLCFFGAWSARVGVLAAGFGGAWLLADEFGAATSTALIVAVAGALAGLILTMLLARFMLFVGGAALGAVVGAKLFTVVEHGDASVLLAVVFVPSVALVSGFLANRFGHRFLVWATAFAGAGLVLSGIGHLDESAHALSRPETAGESGVLTVLWVVLAIAGRTFQTRGPLRRQDRRAERRA